MTKLTELKIEEFAIDLFKEQGYNSDSKGSVHLIV